MRATSPKVVTVTAACLLLLCAAIARADEGSSFHGSWCSERYDRPPVALLACSSEALEFTLTVARLGEGRIKLLSSATDDMDVYVWRRAE